MSSAETSGYSNGAAAMPHWTPNDIPWDDFDKSKVDPELVRIVKAASMVEHNSTDYLVYLTNVFREDPEFQEAVKQWTLEEVQHGKVLGRWAEMADPSFNFDESFKRFTEGFGIELDVKESIRGSRTGELVARCIVETGTSSYYTALKDATDEPVLKEICRRIAADELRHYKLFLDTMKRYRDIENISKWRRFRVALGRIVETEDDELAYAYYATNGDPSQAFERKRWRNAYVQRAYGIYQLEHVRRIVAMTMKAAGMSAAGMIGRSLTKLAYRFMRFRHTRLVRAGA